MGGIRAGNDEGYHIHAYDERNAGQENVRGSLILSNTTAIADRVHLY